MIELLQDGKKYIVIQWQKGGESDSKARGEVQREARAEINNIPIRGLSEGEEESGKVNVDGEGKAMNVDIGRRRVGRREAVRN